MNNMPVFKKILHGLQPFYSAVKGYFIFHQRCHTGSLYPWEFVFFQGHLKSADFQTVFPVFPEKLYDWMKMVGVSRYTGWFENGFNYIFIQGIFGFQNDADISFYTPDFNQAQLTPFNGPWDLDIDKPANDATEKYGYHTPETYGYQSPELKRSMKKNKNRSQDAQENMELQPMF